MLFKNSGLRFAIAALAAALLAAACTPKQDGANDPKARLTEYVSRSFAAKSPQDRKELLGFLAGEARTRLESWSDEQFRQAFIDSKRQFIKMAFKEAKASGPDEMNLTYEITYQASYPDAAAAAPAGEAQGSQNARVTSRKLAQMVRKDGKWLISEVRNVRELVEYKNELTLSPSPAGH